MPLLEIDEDREHTEKYLGMLVIRKVSVTERRVRPSLRPIGTPLLVTSIALEPTFV